MNNIDTSYRQGTRRQFLGGVVISAAGAILAACGGTDATATTVSGPTTAPAGVAPTANAATSGAATPISAPVVMVAATTASTTGAIPVAPVTAMMSTAMPKGQLNIAIGFDFPAKIDALKSGLIALGMQECLTRTTADNKLEPWLAESVVNVNPTTWRITLRQAKFWDGSPVTADDVITAIKKSYDAFPDNKGLISPDTKMTAVDIRTVEFVTPQPSGIFPYALTLANFSIFKTAPDGTASILTGPYKPAKFVVDNELDLMANLDHWAGPPPIAKIIVKNVADPNARILALQSGDVDLLYNFPPEAIKTLGPDFETPIIPSGRVDYISLNFARAPFNDRNVREATTIAIDRNVLNQVGLDGRGTPEATMFPPSTKYDSVPLQTTDVNRAKQLLDDAGWKMGTDGARVKDGKRLAFTLYSYPGRAELTPYAVSIQSQLKLLGYDIQVKEVQNVADVTKTADWDAAMKSNNTIATGDPLFEYNRLLIKGGGDNVGNYSNPQIDDLLTQMRPEIDPAKRQALSKQVQEIVKQDVPVLFLVALPITTAFRKGKVKGYVPNPSDYYFLTRDISVS